MDKNDEIDLLRFLSLFWRRKLLICVISLPVVLLGVLYANSLQPVYRAQAKVLFEPSGSVLSGVSVQVSDALSRIESEIQVARSESILLAVMRDLGLATDARFDRQQRAVDRLLDQLRQVDVDEMDAVNSIERIRRQVGNMVSVRQVNRSTLLSFAAETKDPELAAALSNSFAENYISRQIQSKVESALDSLEIINRAIVEAGENLENSQKQLSGYLLQNAGTIAYTTGNASIALLARDLEATQAALERLDRDRERLVSLIQQGQNEQLGRGFSAAAANELLSGLQLEVFLDLQRRRKGLLNQRDSDGASPNIDEQLAQIEVDIAALASERLEQLAAAATEQQERKTSLRTELEVEIFASDLPPKIASDIFKLQSTATSARTWYTNLVDRADEIAVQSRTQLADSRVVDWATVPRSPSGPDRGRIVAVAMALGLVLACGLALLIDVVWGGITKTRDLEDFLGDRRIYVLPRVNLNKGRASVFKNPFGTFAESLRMILTEIDSGLSSAKPDAAAQQGGKVVGVTSSIVNEGKTVTSIGLASVAALNGHKTCLIDFDFRRPSVSKYIGLTGESGLMAYLAGKQENLHLQRMEFDEDDKIRFDVISGNRNHGEFSFAAIQPARLGALLRDLQQDYDYIFVDMPPILSASETKSIAKQCHSLVFCARQGFGPKRIILEGFNSLISVLPTWNKPIIAMTLSSAGRQQYHYSYKTYKTNKA